MQVKDARVKNKRFDYLLGKILTGDVPQIDVQSLQDYRMPVAYIDCRTPEEFAVSTIPGAIHFDGFSIESDQFKLAKEHTIVVFCSVGYRSEKVCRRLIEKGLTNVYNLYGGIFEWINNGLPIVDGSGNEVKVVHAFSPLWGTWVKGVKKVYSKK